MFVGVTGQIGAGKSTAAGILASFGAVVIDADRVGRRVVDDSLVLRRKLARAFGADVLSHSGRLDRRKVAERAFADAQARKTLNSLVHPYLLKELGKEMRRLHKRHDVVVIDAALLLDWQLDFQVDLVVVIDAPAEERLARMKARGISSDDARARQRLQLPMSEYHSRADVVIVNDGSEAELQEKLRRVWEEKILPLVTRQGRG